MRLIVIVRELAERPGAEPVVIRRKHGVTVELNAVDEVLLLGVSQGVLLQDLPVDVLVEDQVVYVEDPWTVPEIVDGAVPLFAGKSLKWKRME